MTTPSVVDMLRQTHIMLARYDNELGPTTHRIMKYNIPMKLVLDKAAWVQTQHITLIRFGNAIRNMHRVRAMQDVADWDDLQHIYRDIDVLSTRLYLESNPFFT